MHKYNLLDVVEQKIHRADANDCAGALRIFGDRLGLCLTLSEQVDVAPYLLEEWDGEAHFSNPNIPVYVVRK